MPGQRFETALGSDEGSALLLEVPAEVVAALGQRKRPPVRAALNGCVYRTTVAVYGGRYYLPVRKEIREAAGLGPGDPVLVTLELDEEPRVVEIPGDLERVLAADPEARAAFDRLSYTHRKEYVDWIVGARRDETRSRRIERAMIMLRQGRKEP